MSTLAFFQGLLPGERVIFRKVVGAVLEEGLEYRPDAKSRCSRDLVEHIIAHNVAMAELVEDGVIHHPHQVPFDSIDDAVAQLDESFGNLLEGVGAIDEESWLEPATFFVGDHVVMEGSREQLAWALLLDSIHHRGQLTTHLRAMGSKVPAMYGPSADEPMDH